MTLTTTDLRKICDAATWEDAPWEADIAWCEVISKSTGNLIAECSSEERTAFIATFNPTRVRAMLDEIDALTARAEAAEALVKEAGEVLFKLHHAACGKTGFAAAVRLDSMKAYPWPALDIADEAAAAFLAKIQPKGKTDE